MGGSGDDNCHFAATEFDLPAVSAHDLHDEGALMRVGCADDGVNRLDDAVESGISADGHVRAAEVVVDGSDHAGNVETLVLCALLCRDSVRLQKLVQQAAPFDAEQVGAGQGAVTADDNEVCDSLLDEILGGLQAAPTLFEVHATGRSYDGTATVDDAGHCGPVSFSDVLAAIDHSLVALFDEVDLQRRATMSMTVN